MVADGCVAQERLDEAMGLLDKAKVRSSQHEERWCEAEVHRLTGEVNMARRCEAEAEKDLLKALEVAQHQKALFWELRAAFSLAGLWLANGKAREARDLLTPICERFEQGLETADLVGARTLLIAL